MKVRVTLDKAGRIMIPELSMLALHLLQICMVYVNTLMIQQMLAERQWARHYARCGAEVTRRRFCCEVLR